MPPTLTATPQPANTPPRVQLQTSGFTGSTVTITRTASNGDSAQVRTANPGNLATAAWFDVEMPYPLPVTYTAVSNTGDTATAVVPAFQTLGVTRPWLIHVGIPALSMPVTVQAYGDRTRPANQGVHRILGRKFPLVRTDGVRGAATFDVTVRTVTETERAALAMLLATSTPLLLQYVTADGPRSFSHYVSVGDVVEAEIVNLTSTYLAWTLPCTTVDVPTGLQQAQWTCAGVLATYTSSSQVRARYATCTDLLINNPRAA